ncbi:hypothetical protein RRG08_023503 [Elysia crispata]|uniref:Uncharacterized protein n=1 Tax=Elysia crispata TaxID=231223 RepID=A0AAE0YYQ4_9GAST|nr:hypothetical protein RRG08_023503 [Elysia crispata]
MLMLFTAVANFLTDARVANPKTLFIMFDSGARPLFLLSSNDIWDKEIPQRSNSDHTTWGFQILKSYKKYLREEALTSYSAIRPYTSTPEHEHPHPPLKHASSHSAIYLNTTARTTPSPTQTRIFTFGHIPQHHSTNTPLIHSNTHLHIRPYTSTPQHEQPPPPLKHASSHSAIYLNTTARTPPSSIQTRTVTFGHIPQHQSTNNPLPHSNTHLHIWPYTSTPQHEQPPPPLKHASSHSAIYLNTTARITPSPTQTRIVTFGHIPQHHSAYLHTPTYTFTIVHRAGCI